MHVFLGVGYILPLSAARPLSVSCQSWSITSHISNCWSSFSRYDVQVQVLLEKLGERTQRDWCWHKIKVCKRCWEDLTVQGEALPGACGRQVDFYKYPINNFTATLHTSDWRSTNQWTSITLFLGSGTWEALKNSLVCIIKPMVIHLGGVWRAL